VLGAGRLPGPAEWTSGWSVAHGTDVLIHDTQYTADEYADRQGWGHSSIEDSVAFARQVEAATLVTFHHDPGHTDAQLAELTARAAHLAGTSLRVVGGREGIEVPV
jgi:ribonuclease BN (tRNA processing enzyme)